MIGPLLFAALVWGSIVAVLAAFGYVVWMLVVASRQQTPRI